jgi:hypothetical protein
MKIMNVGSKITISEFAYTNKSGGTGISKPFSKRFEGNEYFEEPVEVMVIKKWDDYETGVRGWALPDQKNKKLMEFLKRNCKEGEPVSDDIDGWNHQSGEFVLYWSEFDII